jgi:hypothetical protein
MQHSMSTLSLDLASSLADAVDTVLKHVYDSAMSARGVATPFIVRDFQERLHQIATAWSHSDLWGALAEWPTLERARLMLFLDEHPEHPEHPEDEAAEMIMSCSIASARALYRKAHLFYGRYNIGPSGVQRSKMAEAIQAQIMQCVQTYLADRRAAGIMPEVLDVPEVPDVPEEPCAVPDVPEVPDVPDAPDVPELRPRRRAKPMFRDAFF